MANGDLGFFLGGVAKGQQSLAQQQIQERQVGVSERQASQNEASNVLNQSLESLSQIFEAQKLSRDENTKAELEKLSQTITQSMGPAIEALGLDPGVIQARIQALKAAPTAAQKAEQEAITKAQGQVTGAETILGGPLNQGQRQQLAGVTAPGGSKSEFQRLLGDLEVLRGRVASGDLKADDEQVKLVESRLNKLTQTEGGFSISLSPDGRVVVTQGGIPGAPGAGGGGQLFEELSPNQQLEQSERFQELQSSIGLVDRLIEETISNPTAFGAAGTVRGVVQKGLGALGSLGDIIKSTTGKDMDETREDILNFLEDDPELEKELGGFFDPQLAQQEILENTLAFQIARSRIKGGGDIRAVTQAFKDAKGEIRLTGLVGVDDVRSRLLGVRRIFQQELEGLSGAVTGQDPAISQVPEIPGQQPRTTAQSKVKRLRFDAQGNLLR